jgi:hypothetical protein
MSYWRLFTRSWVSRIGNGSVLYISAEPFANLRSALATLKARYLRASGSAAFHGGAVDPVNGLLPDRMQCAAVEGGATVSGQAASGLRMLLQEALLSFIISGWMLELPVQNRVLGGTNFILYLYR